MIFVKNSLPKSHYIVKIIQFEIIKGQPDEALVVMEYCEGLMNFYKKIDFLQKVVIWQTYLIQ